MYLALYRKYRSQTFDEVVSQEHITTTLKNQIKTGKPAHAYLFTGSRGTGKTTCAKLMAKAVNCLNPVDGNPCGECEVCRAIADGCPDIIEMDAASNNGVDDVRALRDEVMYSPVQCRYKVYIIDEVHMMSGSAFNALLKTIEEPPPHVIFILATTELHKVPATIVSRCQQYRFRRISVEDSVKRLSVIAERENVTLEKSAAVLISRLSDGGMRDAVSLLDQCISVSDNVTEKIVQDIAGVAGGEHLIAFADRIYDNDIAGCIELLDELYQAGRDAMRLLDELTLHYRNLCILKSMSMDFSLIPAGYDKQELKRQASKFSIGEIMRCMEILQDASAKSGRAASRKTAAEMCFVRLCTPALDTDTKGLSLRIEKLEQQLKNIASGITPVKVAANPEPQRAIASPEPQKTTASPEPQRVTANPEPQRATANSEPQRATEKPTPVPVQPPEPVTDGRPAWLFEGDTTPTKLSEAFTDMEAPPISGSDDYDPDELPFDIDEPVNTVIPQATDIPPITGGEDYNPDELPFDIDKPEGATTPQAVDIPPVPEIPPEPDTSGKADIRAISGGNDIWLEIVNSLPMTIAVTVEKMTAEIDGNIIHLSGGTQFNHDMLKSGLTLKRIATAAEKITGHSCTVDLKPLKADSKQSNDGILSDFLLKAEEMGVNIKHKK